MKAEQKFDRYTAALDLGYTPEQIEHFETMRKVLAHWNNEVRKNAAMLDQMPHYREEDLLPYRIYMNKLLGCKAKILYRQAQELPM